jgi:Domain of unknown function (DUF6458)
MGIGVGLLLIAVGAILAFAVNAEISGVDVQVVGWILMIVGLVGILLDLMLWQSWRRGYRRAAYVEGEPLAPAPPRGRTTYVEEEQAGPPPGAPGPPTPPP